ncbi:peptidoglycan-binding protein [Micromonospora sonneratiae]|uniref:Peptidoglycan-binding protein n=1 Tax=Micromonospora sonneratiae TaxID=1184706 RepID=A0ABW3YI46_9ACTN
MVLVVGAAVAATLGFGDRDRGTAGAGRLPEATAKVTRQTLIDAQTVAGKLGYGPTRTTAARVSGTVTWLAATGATIKRGKPLYSVDDDRVVLLYGTLPAYRMLTAGVRGADVRQFEQNLRALGYSGFTVDDEYTASTASAVRKWQDDIGVDETGRVEPGRIVYAAGEVRVDSHQLAVGDEVRPGRAVLDHTGTSRLVTVELNVADQRLARPGAKVSVVLPDGGRADGTVADAETVIKTPAGANGQAEAETKIEVNVAVADPTAFAEFDRGTVDVSFTASERADVLTVPVAALLALAEGGYGVQVVEGVSTRIVTVRTGLFASGRVEISGDGITEGLTVGVPG